MTYLIKTISNV